MSRDQLIGWILVAVSLIVMLVYSWIMWFEKELWVVLTKLTLTIAVVAVMGILAWIGYTLATTPPPKPIEEIEKEIEEELKKLEQEVKQQSEQASKV